MIDSQGNAKKGDRISAAAWRDLVKKANRGARAIRIVENSGLTIRDDPNGYVIGTDTRKRPTAAAAEEAAANTKQFKVSVAKESDYLECHTWDGTTEGAGIVRVAKPWFLRGPKTWKPNESRLNIGYSNYNSNTGQHRDATKSGKTERQVIVPLYDDGDVILAVRAKTGITVPGAGPDDPATAVVWADLNADGRMWQVTE